MGSTSIGFNSCFYCFRCYKIFKNTTVGFNVGSLKPTWGLNLIAPTLYNIFRAIYIYMRFRFNISVSLDFLSDDEFVYPFLNIFNKDIAYSSVCSYQRIIYDKLNPILVSMLLRRSNSFQERKRRLYRRIEYMVERGPCIFVTLTLGRDDYSFSYVRNSVSTFLRQFDYYVANADWGKLNDRLHYHAVVLAEHVDHRSWPLGLINFERIYVSEKSCKKLAKYVAKLTNHAVKKTVKGSRCIYSKNFSKLGL